jgi:tetratricopeptide (TPR) repeat protein
LQKKYAKAIEAYTQVIALHGATPRDHYVLGLVYKELKQMDKGAQEFKLAASQTTGQPRAMAERYLKQCLKDSSK